MGMARRRKISFSRLMLVRPSLAAALALLTLSLASGATPEASLSGVHSPSLAPVFHPLGWHRGHWRQRMQRDPGVFVELPWTLFEPYPAWGHASTPQRPPRPEAPVPRQRRELWRDDVVGAGNEGRVEVHPQGRILRSRPRPE